MSITSTSLNLSPDTRPQTGSLPSHRVLSFAGPDAANFLQGYLTCDTALLSAATALPAAFTTLKGRVLANGWVWGSGTDVQMLVAESLTQPVSDFLRPYMNFSRTKLEISDQPPLVALHTPNAEGIAIGDTRCLVHSKTDDTRDLSAAWLAECIATAEVVVTLPVSETYLPQMLGLTELGAVSFEKGCYLGQEVVARAQHRGEVKRRLRSATYNSSSPLQPADVLTDAAGKRLGNVVCSTDQAVLLVSAATDPGTQEWFREGESVSLDFGAA